jgi:hypothetical protein
MVPGFINTTILEIYYGRQGRVLYTTTHAVSLGTRVYGTVPCGENNVSVATEI